MTRPFFCFPDIPKSGEEMSWLNPGQASLTVLLSYHPFKVTVCFLQKSLFKSSHNKPFYQNTEKLHDFRAISSEVRILGISEVFSCWKHSGKVPRVWQRNSRRKQTSQPSENPWKCFPFLSKGLMLLAKG